MSINTERRRQREADARKEQILKAARQCFLDRGIPGTSMDEIARTAELAKGTLYLYFSSKEEIAFSLLLRATEDLLRTLEAVLDSGVQPIEQIQRLALAYYRFFISQPEAFRYMFVIPHNSYSGRVAEELVMQWGNTGKAALGILSALLEQGKMAGDFDFQDAWSAAIGLWSALTGVIAIPSQEVRRPFLGEPDLERIVMDTVCIVLRGLQPPGKRMEQDR